MIDRIYDWCVQLLLFLAAKVGMTYEALNIWIFVVIWPVFTIVLIGVVIWQYFRIRKLSKENLQ